MENDLYAMKISFLYNAKHYHNTRYALPILFYVGPCPETTEKYTLTLIEKFTVFI
jgi:hypothetical protein